jgi:NAD(P)H-nitrite reductase large subunit
MSVNKNKIDNEDLIICRCEEISKKEILEAITDGARDLRGVRIRTRAGMGLCQGRSCEVLVRKIISQQLRTNLKELPPSTGRPPVRPIGLKLFMEDDNGFKE